MTTTIRAIKRTQLTPNRHIDIGTEIKIPADPGPFVIVDIYDNRIGAVEATSLHIDVIKSNPFRVQVEGADGIIECSNLTTAIRLAELINRP